MVLNNCLVLAYLVRFSVFTHSSTDWLKGFSRAAPGGPFNVETLKVLRWKCQTYKTSSDAHLEHNRPPFSQSHTNHTILFIHSTISVREDVVKNIRLFLTSAIFFAHTWQILRRNTAPSSHSLKARSSDHYTPRDRPKIALVFRIPFTLASMFNTLFWALDVTRPKLVNGTTVAPSPQDPSYASIINDPNHSIDHLDVKPSINCSFSPSLCIRMLEPILPTRLLSTFNSPWIYGLSRRGRL